MYFFYGTFGQRQSFGDFAIGCAAPQQSKNRQLALAQAFSSSNSNSN
jgi:hypothetical protein